MPQQILPDVVDEARRLGDAALERGVEARAIGGVAVGLHAERGLPPALTRVYGDIDLVSAKRAGRNVARFLVEMGYVPNERFNKMNGSTRLVFYDNEHGRQIDVFVGEFHMCHSVPVADRLHLDPRTVPLAELLLTKLQVVHLNEKDLKDIWGIVVEHDVQDHDDESVNAGFVARTLAADWGFWRTSRQTMDDARARLPGSGLDALQQELVETRLARLWERVEAEPKSLRWRARARIGERTRWYEEPEEIAHASRT